MHLRLKISFDGNIGDTTPLTSITVTQSNGTTFSGDVATGTLTITDTVDGQSVTFADAKDVDLTTGFTISNAATDNYNVVINSSTFDAAGVILTFVPELLPWVTIAQM